MTHFESSRRRRDFLKELFAGGSLLPLCTSSALAGMADTPFDEESAQSLNPDLDAEAFSFWRDFLSRDAQPIVETSGQHRGAAAENSLQPVFMHYGREGFRNAAKLDGSKLISDGDVVVSVNTSAVKLSPKGQETFRRLQNAQLRLDVIQKTPILPILEAMAYTVVAGMRAARAGASKQSGESSASGKSVSPVQSITVESDAAWQRMQNIPLPGGEGRWALNLEGQKKDSLFDQVLQRLLKDTGRFAPLLGLPGLAVSGLQSFDLLYGALHAMPVSIIKAPPTRVFATQEALNKTGSPGGVTGILLHSGTYALIAAKEAPTEDQLKALTVMQGRIVPPKTPTEDLDLAAAETLKDATYVTFDVGVSRATFLTGGTPKKGNDHDE